MQGYGGNPGPVWPQDESFFTDMTAIVLVYTKAGFIVAADGRCRWNDDSTRDEFTYQNESEQEQKVFKGAFGTVEIAWAVTGTVFSKGKRFNLITETQKALDAANSSTKSFGDWLDAFAFTLRDSVSLARKSGTLEPYSENERHDSSSEGRFLFATIYMAGYFGHNGRPGIARVRLLHHDGELNDPQIMIHLPPRNGGIVSGSDEISHRYFEPHQDGRFKRYFSAYGPTIQEGLAHARGYIEACSDPLAAELDPLCKGIGGHIHAAAVRDRKSVV